MWRDGHFVATHDDRRWNVVNVAEDKVKIYDLTASPQIFRAVSPGTCRRRCTAPRFDDTCGLEVRRAEAGMHQAVCDPGASHLVLFTEFAPAACSDQSDRLVPGSEIVRCGNNVAKA